MTLSLIYYPPSQPLDEKLFGPKKQKAPVL